MNKTKFNLLFLVFTFWSVMHVDAQTFQWAKRIGNVAPATQAVNATATDGSGNVYTTGYFSGTVDFDPNVGTVNLTSNSGSQEIYVCKISPTGNLVWAKSFSGSMPDWATSISTDAGGNVYVTGLFQGTVDFDPGVAVFNLTTTGGTDVFLLKLTSAGNLAWVVKFGSTGADYVKGIAADASGNIYIAGSSAGAFDADPSPSVFTVSGNFVIKMSSAGGFFWARLVGGMSTAIAVDGSGNICIIGQFSGSVDFDPIGTFTLTSAGNLDVFVSKFTPAGVFAWAKRLGGTGNDMASGIAVDAAGNVHTLGSFDDVCDFDPGASAYNLTSTAGGLALDMFICKLNTNGLFVWAKRIGGANGANGAAIDLDVSGNVYTTGGFSGTVDFNPGTSTNNLVAASANEAFILKLNASGNYVWAYDLSATTGVNGLSITIDPFGGIISSGTFTGTGDFNPYSGVANLTSNGNSNIYVLKLYVSPLPIELISFSASQYNNEVEVKWQTATETSNNYFTIEKSKDGNEFVETGKLKGAGNSTTILDYSFLDNNPYIGISYYRLKQTDFNGDFSYSVVVAVRITGSKNNVIAYPNPFRNRLNVVINTTKENLPYTIILSDLAGRILLSQNAEASTAFSRFEINTSGLAKGVYALMVTSQGESWKTKVVLE